MELPNTIDGLVHITDLTDDYYHYDEKQMVLIGERTGRIFKLSDKVKVKVVACDKKERTIDFEVVGMQPRKKKSKIVQINDRKIKTKRTKKGKINKSNHRRTRRRR